MLTNTALKGMGSIIFNQQPYDSNYIQSSINHIFSLFEKQNISSDKTIGIAINRSPQLLAAIIAALEYGVPFLPIDLALPSDRIHYMLKDSNIKNIIVSPDYPDLFSGYQLIIIDDVLDAQPRNNRIHKNEIAYVLYTSGSTGNPKGVEVTREGLQNFIEGISEIIDFSPGKRIACFTTVSFDIFFLESVMALYKESTVVLANEDEQRNPKLLAKLIQDNTVDTVQMTPSRMQLLLNHDKEISCLKSVKEIMIGGEPFPLSLLRALQGKTTAKIYNMYGPTETTIWSTVSDLTHKERIDIGRPIKNTEVYIVDESLSILSNGQTGEICIAGKGLARGYVSRDGLTTEKFICLPQKPDVKVYRTGDMGLYLSDGDLECLGRTDNQVKIRGHRIELEEIESHLNQFDGIKQSVVIALETNEIDRIFGAYYVSEISIDSKDIVNYLSLKLPSYMIPSVFKRVEKFIENANGKIDRKRVLECVEVKSDDAIPDLSVSDELTDIQKRAFKVIFTNLSEKVSDNVSLDMDFNSIGLDSITFIKTIVALECEFDFEFDDEMLLITKFPTVKSMVEYVELKINQL